MAGVRKLQSGTMQGWFKHYEGHRAFFTLGRRATRREVLNAAQTLEVEHAQIRLGIKPRPDAQRTVGTLPIGEAVAEFLEQLRKHNLITETSAVRADAGPEPAADHRGHWEPPMLSVYEDMKDLLLLDPIHDVDEQGWPARKPDQVV